MYIVHNVSSLRDNGFDYLEFRLWIGLWSGFLCLVLVATDASFLVQYFTRFTEEGFSALISFIFIYDAFKKMIKLAHHNPINSEYDPNLVTQYGCRCEPGRYRARDVPAGAPNSAFYNKIKSSFSVFKLWKRVEKIN